MQERGRMDKFSLAFATRACTG